jgi:hypothetical protein
LRLTIDLWRDLDQRTSGEDQHLCWPPPPPVEWSCSPPAYGRLCRSLSDLMECVRGARLPPLGNDDYDRTALWCSDCQTQRHTGEPEQWRRLVQRTHRKLNRRQLTWRPRIRSSSVVRSRAAQHGRPVVVVGRNHHDDSRSRPPAAAGQLAKRARGITNPAGRDDGGPQQWPRRRKWRRRGQKRMAIVRGDAPGGTRTQTHTTHNTRGQIINKIYPSH